MVITFITDFGTRDGYVGAMKGVALSVNPAVACVDITHDIPSGDIRAAAWVLASTCKYFPAQTVHVVVVDPGVGSARRGVVWRSEQCTIVCPDNGVLSLLILQQDKFEVYEITNRSLFQSANVSSTFHGRDIFAPVAAHLTSGTEPSKVGIALDPSSLITFEPPSVRAQGDTIIGQIVYVDIFGNLITNISSDLLGESSYASIDAFEIPLGKTYSSVQVGEPVAYGGSHGVLEIGLNGGSAQQQFHAAYGHDVTLHRARTGGWC